MKLKFSTLAVGLFMSMTANSTQIFHLDSRTMRIGQGYDAQNQTAKSNCLEKISKIEGSSSSGIGIVAEVSQSELEKSLGIEAGGKYRTGATTISAKAEFSNRTAQKGHSISMTYKSDFSFAPELLGDYKWTPIARDLLTPKVEGHTHVPGQTYSEEEWRGAVEAKNPQIFAAKCGDEFVDTRTREARFYYNLRVDFVSEEDKKRIAGEFKLSSTALKLNASFEKKMKSVSSKTKITVSALQIGGRVENIGAIFGSNPMNPDETGVSSFVECSSGNYKPCFEVLVKAIEYANDKTEGFPSTLNSENPKPGEGPSITSSITQKYTDVTGLTDFNSPALDITIRNRRDSLNEAFESILQSWIWAKRISQSGIPRLSSAQEDERLKIETDAYKALNDLAVIYIQPCYENFNLCLSIAPVEVVKYYETLAAQFAAEVNFQPSSFAALCDQGLSGALSREEEKTIRAIIAVLDKPIVDESTGEQYQPIASSSDVCGAAETELDNVYELDLSGKELKDLSPLRFATHLNQLNLAKNRLNGQSLQSLDFLRELEVLNLSGNQLRALLDFPKIPSLQRLYLNDNRLQSVEVLTSLAENLEYLNLSAAGRGVDCPFEDVENRCVTKDYSRFTSFSESTRSQWPRVGSQLVQLNEQNLLIIGGLGQTKPEVLHLPTMAFHEIDKTVHQTHGTSFTALGNNQILVFGGDTDSSEPAMVLQFSSNGEFQTTEVIHSQMPNLFRHEAIRLKDGRVLLTGGLRDRGTPQASDLAILFDPISRSFSRVTHLGEARVNHKMVELEDGRVLIIGGNTVSVDGKHIPINTIEVFDPASNQVNWFADRLIEPRYGHDATLLEDGTVLVTGGFTESLVPIADGLEITRASDLTRPSRTAELIDPYGRVDFTDYDMSEPRAFHKAVRLDTGNVALFGGVKTHIKIKDDSKQCYGCMSSAEVFDPKRSDFTDSGKLMSVGRALFDAMPLKNKRVLLLGGAGKAQYSSEIFSYNGL